MSLRPRKIAATLHRFHAPRLYWWPAIGANEKVLPEIKKLHEDVSDGDVKPMCFHDPPNLCARNGEPAAPAQWHQPHSKNPGCLVRSLIEHSEKSAYQLLV